MLTACFAFRYKEIGRYEVYFCFCNVCFNVTDIITLYVTDIYRSFPSTSTLQVQNCWRNFVTSLSRFLQSNSSSQDTIQERDNDNEDTCG